MSHEPALLQTPVTARGPTFERLQSRCERFVGTCFPGEPAETEQGGRQLRRRLERRPIRQVSNVEWTRRLQAGDCERDLIGLDVDEPESLSWPLLRGAASLRSSFQSVQPGRISVVRRS